MSWRHPVQAGRALTRRVSGPLDRSAFASRRAPALPSRVTSELSPLWLYRLGLSGINSKYRVVPRCAITRVDDLRDAVVAWDSAGPVSAAVEALWQHYGAHSPELVQTFIRVGQELDALPCDCEPSRIASTLAPVEQAAARRGLRRGRAARQQASLSVGEAKAYVLERWLDVCRPRSRAARAVDMAELGVCFTFRRVRQEWWAFSLRVRRSRQP